MVDYLFLIYLIFKMMWSLHVVSMDMKLSRVVSNPWDRGTEAFIPLKTITDLIYSWEKKLTFY